MLQLPKAPLLLLASSLISCSEDSKPETQSLFDGKSLTGWHLQKESTNESYATNTENFIAKDGALHCYQSKDRKGSLILTDETYDDFELTLDIKSTFGNDSGIFLRCTEAGQGIQIMNDYIKDGAIGFLFGQGTGAFISRPIILDETDGNVIAKDKYDGQEIDKLDYAIDAAGFNKIWKQDDWNTLKVRCVGEVPKITTWINGTKVMEMDGATYAARGLKHEKKLNWDSPTAWNAEEVHKITGGKGSIGLQVHPGKRWAEGTPASYRNITIKEIK